MPTRMHALQVAHDQCILILEMHRFRQDNRGGILVRKRLRFRHGNPGTGFFNMLDMLDKFDDGFRQRYARFRRGRS